MQLYACTRLRNAQICLRTIGLSEVILAGQVSISLGILTLKMEDICTVASGHSYLKTTVAVVSADDRMPIYKGSMLPLQVGPKATVCPTFRIVPIC